ncbi:unnamed protein product [Prunus armeniaca]|uniref:Uncharacterized protein n=1 Tax=Prunus armeniaca TaxID=36596 RepID=A0A6J5TXX0_PRUAR|nr:unnamed protein product [Prunus armeniaca]CAB4299019.1 unnamed protein product [Prunus armeniaca]
MIFVNSVLGFAKGKHGKAENRNGEWGTTHAREYHLHNTAHHLKVRDWTKATGFFTVRRWLEK